MRPAPSCASAVTLISVVLCLVLVASEVYRYVVPTQKEHMVVDPGIEGRLRINFDITFPALQCSEANLDAMDVAGEQQNGIDHDMTKTRCVGVPGGGGRAARMTAARRASTRALSL